MIGTIYRYLYLSRYGYSGVRYLSLTTGAGGAIYLSCNTLDSLCLVIMKRSLGLPVESSVAQAIVLTNNTAFGYGNDIATFPKKTVVHQDYALAMVPGIDFLNVGLALSDGFGQIVKGTAKVLLPFIFESWLCASAACGIEQSLGPTFFVPFDSASGISNSLPLNQRVTCALDSPNITILFGLYSSQSVSAQVISSAVSIRCSPCGKSQVRVESESGSGSSTWYCAPCNEGQYIIDPDKDSCQNCPIGTKLNILMFSYQLRISLIRIWTQERHACKMGLLFPR